MPVGKDFSETVVERIKREPEFAAGVLSEAAALLVNGEPETARIVLRNLVNATTGFKALSRTTHVPDKSLHRMLGSNGNPTLDNLTGILRALRENLGVELRVEAVPLEP
jgi:DNA-binding phage protein